MRPLPASEILHRMHASWKSQGIEKCDGTSIKMPPQQSCGGPIEDVGVLQAKAWPRGLNATAARGGYCPPPFPIERQGSDCRFRGIAEVA